MGVVLKDGMQNPGAVAFCEALTDGRLRLGQTLTQNELGEVLGLTLARVRDVVVLLEAEGLVEVRKRVGLTIFYPDVNFVGNTFQLRGILEREGLRKFSETVTQSWIDYMLDEHDKIVELVKSCTEAGQYAREMRALERKFHDSFVTALNNEHITKLHGSNSQKMYLLRLLNPEAVGPRNSLISMSEHLEILRALQQRDADAAILGLDRHLKGVLHRILTH